MPNTIAECIANVEIAFDDVATSWLEVLCNQYETEHQWDTDKDVGATAEMLASCRWLAICIRQLLQVWALTVPIAGSEKMTSKIGIKPTDEIPF